MGDLPRPGPSRQFGRAWAPTVPHVHPRPERGRWHVIRRRRRADDRLVATQVAARVGSPQASVRGLGSQPWPNIRGAGREGCSISRGRPTPAILPQGGKIPILVAEVVSFRIPKSLRL
jgi:hypothetical protein